MDGSSSLPGCDLAKMIRKHPLLVLLSVLCKSLQRSLIFIALPFSACALFGKAGAKVRCFLIPSKCFERKVCESWQFFALFYKIRVKRGRFGGNGRKKGIFREHDHLVMEAAREAKRGPIVGKRCLGGAKQGQENRGNGARRTETRVSYDWEAIFSLLYIYIAQERRKWPLRARAPLLPSWGRPKPHRPSFGMVSGRVRDGKPHANKHISHASRATGPPHSNRLKSGVKNEVNFVAL